MLFVNLIDEFSLDMFDFNIFYLFKQLEKIIYFYVSKLLGFYMSMCKMRVGLYVNE